MLPRRAIRQDVWPATWVRAVGTWARLHFSSQVRALAYPPPGGCAHLEQIFYFGTFYRAPKFPFFWRRNLAPPPRTPRIAHLVRRERFTERLVLAEIDSRYNAAIPFFVRIQASLARDYAVPNIKLVSCRPTRRQRVTRSQKRRPRYTGLRREYPGMFEADPSNYTEPLR